MERLGSARATILLVEDEEAVRSLLELVLTRAGYAVLQAASGVEALAVAAGHTGPIDLILTDAVLPGLRGPELAARLAGTRPEARVLFMSGYASGPEVDGVSGQNGSQLLVKPFSPGELTARVGEILGV